MKHSWKVSTHTEQYGNRFLTYVLHCWITLWIVLHLLLSCVFLFVLFMFWGKKQYWWHTDESFQWVSCYFIDLLSSICSDALHCKVFLNHVLWHETGSCCTTPSIFPQIWEITCFHAFAMLWFTFLRHSFHNRPNLLCDGAFTDIIMQISHFFLIRKLYITINLSDLCIFIVLIRP